MTRTTLALFLGLIVPAAAHPKPLDFRYRLLSQGHPVATRVTAQGGAGRITVHGELGTPNPCQALTATQSGSGRDLVLRVVARPKGEMCVATLGGYAYDAALEGLRPGTYRVRVTHQLPATGTPAPRMVLDRTVRVR